MKLKNFFAFWAIIALVMCVSCNKDNEPFIPDPDYPTVSNGFYVLNQGNYYSGIEGSFNVVDYNSSEAMLNVFQKVNGRSIGSTPQCGIAYGSKIYMGIYDSNTIEIISRGDYRSLKQILLNGTESPGTNPRSMVAHGGKIYVSMFNGYVARIDTATLTIDATLKVGPNPENMAVYNGKLYVPNSDGMNYVNGKYVYGETASVIDLNSFTVTRTLKVPLNPNKFIASRNGLYLLCNGDYEDIPAAIYKVNDSLYEYIDAATIAEACGDYLCYVNDPFYGMGIAEYKKYDLKTGEISEWEIKRPEYANTIYYDAVAERIIMHSLKYYGNIWPSYELPGYVAVYDKNGLHLKDYECGVGPACIFNNAE